MNLANDGGSAKNMIRDLDRALSEAQWAREVKEYAQAHGWRVAHMRAVQLASGRWTTPNEGDEGFPDWVFARDGEVILAELKSETGRETAHQRAWLDAAHGYLWRPSDRAGMERRLA